MHTTALKDFYLVIVFRAIIFFLFLFIGDTFFAQQNQAAKQRLSADQVRMEDDLSLSCAIVPIGKKEKTIAIINRERIHILNPESS